MTHPIPRPGRYWLTGRPDEVVRLLVDAHRSGQLAAVAPPVHCELGHVAVRVRIGRPPSVRVRVIAASVLAVLVVLAALVAVGSLAASWALAHGAVLAIGSALVRGLLWLSRRES